MRFLRGRSIERRKQHRPLRRARVQLGFEALENRRLLSGDGIASGVAPSALQLEIDEATGRAFLANRSDTEIAVIGYTITDPSGTLTPTTWVSLDDADYENATWLEASAAVDDLSEINPSSSSELAANETVFIGAITDPAGPRDLILEYAVLGDAALQTGDVVYSQMAFADTVLTVQVNAASGQARFVNQTSASIDLIGYTLSSTSFALTPEHWSSFDDQSIDNDEWLESSATSDDLSEINPLDSTTIEMDSIVPIGRIYNTSFPRDVELTYLVNGASELTIGFVEFIDPPLLSGDYDGSGVVDAADYTVWRDQLGDVVAFYDGADGDGSGIVEEIDYTIWQQSFGTSLPPEEASLVVASNVGAVLSGEVGSVQDLGGLYVSRESQAAFSPEVRASEKNVTMLRSDVVVSQPRPHEETALRQVEITFAGDDEVDVTDAAFGELGTAL